jgi:enamine deaminase RidA (YjgF/YER057c/UK114 family)
VTIERIDRGPRMSRAVVHGDTVYTAGHVAVDVMADVAGQTREILARIDALLAQAGTDKSKLISGMVWLADIGTFDEMNAVWDAWIDPKNPPVRACVEARLARPGLRVEIAVVAARS